MPDQDPETMPLEELMALANAAPETEEVFDVVEPEAPVVTQPRGPDGKFISAEPVVSAVVETPEPTSYSRTIDLGDGSGAQVFTAATKDELLDKLADAQKHATIKIRDQNRILKATPKAPAKKELTPDEEYLLGQRFISEPSKAFKELAEAEYGMPFEEIKAAAAAARQHAQERVAEANADLWVKNTPGYFPNEANARKMKAYVNKMFGGDQSVENLTAAYQDLKESGLLQEKPAAPPVVPVVAAPAAPRARASSLSSRISTVAAPPSGHTEADLYKMPLHELEALANQRG